MFDRYDVFMIPLLLYPWRSLCCEVTSLYQKVACVAHGGGAAVLPPLFLYR